MADPPLIINAGPPPTSGDKSNGEFPQWVRIIGYLADRIGIPVLALWLVWVAFMGDLRSVRDEARAEALHAQTHRQETTALLNVVVPLLRQICLSGAKSAIEAKGCL